MEKFKKINDSKLCKVVGGMDFDTNALHSPYCHLCGQKKTIVVAFANSNTYGVMCLKCHETKINLYIQQARINAFSRSRIPSTPDEIETPFGSPKLKPLPPYYYNGGEY